MFANVCSALYVTPLGAHAAVLTETGGGDGGGAGGGSGDGGGGGMSSRAVLMHVDAHNAPAAVVVSCGKY